MTIGNEYENLLLASVFGDRERLVALHTADPGEDGTTGEVVGGGYSRLTMLFTNPPVGGQVSNRTDLAFTNLPAADVTHVSIWEKPVDGGRHIWSGPLDDMYSMLAGMTFRIPAGGLVVTLN